MAEPTKTQDQKTKAPRHRSPAYPSISLRRALDRAKEFYAAQKHHAAPATATVGIWGFGAKSSGGLQTISALKQYGFMNETGEGDSRQLQLTEAALAIVRDEREPSPDRDAAIRKAAMMPKIHADMWKKWGVQLPVEATVKYYLVHERGYNEASVGDLIASYKDTMAFAKLAESDKSSKGEDDFSSGTDDIPPASFPPKGKPIMEGERVVFTQEIEPAHGVRVVASGDVDGPVLAALDTYVQQQRNRFFMLSLEKLLNAGFVEKHSREMWYSRELRMAFSHQAIREMDPHWIERHIAEQVAPDDFVFHFIRLPKDSQNCNDILKEIGLPKLHANIRFATIVG